MSVKYGVMNDTEHACEASKLAPPGGGENDKDSRHELQRPGPETPRDAPDPVDRQDDTAAPREIGGRKGPDPVRYGDWEKNGRCIDF